MPEHDPVNAMPWEIITPRWTTGSLTGRRPDLLEEVCQQFDVEHARRYDPNDEDGTNCNAYAWDCTKALGCELPYWWYRTEQTVNRMLEWLRKHGAAHGWWRINAAYARERANRGFPTLAVWANPSGKGHVAILLPSPDGSPQLIAQAGRRNLWRRPIGEGFGAAAAEVEYWTHD